MAAWSPHRVFVRVYSLIGRKVAAVVVVQLPYSFQGARQNAMFAAAESCFIIIGPILRPAMTTNRQRSKQE